jgi:hypothetical protein
VASLVEILHQRAEAEGLHFKLAVIQAEVPKALIAEALQQGRIRPLPGVPELTTEALGECTRVVGQMGTEPFIRALKGGAEVIIAGRSCDTAIYAGLPLMQGYDPGLTLHMAKIIECGALCAHPPAASDSILGVIRPDHFLIRSLNPQRVVTPETVASHSLYEQANPFRLEEPEGIVDISEAEFEQVDSQTVRVSGSRYRERDIGVTIKLEGAALRGYRAVTIAGVRDPAVIDHLDDIESLVRQSVAQNTAHDAAAFQLDFRYYGRDAVLGQREPLRSQTTHEVGVLIEVMAEQQDLADSILALARSLFLHCSFPGRKTTAGNLAFPFSPSDLSAGAVYEFNLYHVLDGESQEKLFPVEYVQV